MIVNSYISPSSTSSRGGIFGADFSFKNKRTCVSIPFHPMKKASPFVRSAHKCVNPFLKIRKNDCRQPCHAFPLPEVPSISVNAKMLRLVKKNIFSFCSPSQFKEWK
jgi:hypothetical protein